MKKGVTLVETLIALTITTTMGAVIISTLLSGQSYYSRERDFTRNQAEITSAIAQMEKTIRMANNFTIYDNILDMNPVTSDGTVIELLDVKGTPGDSSDDETVYFYIGSGTTNLYSNSSIYGTKQLARNINFLTFSENGLLIIIDTQINVPYGALDYSTSVKLRN